MHKIAKREARAIRYPRSESGIRLIVAFGVLVTGASASGPPDLARKVAERETRSELERGNYTYRQTVIVEEMKSRGGKGGEYREVRDVLFTPEGLRTEEVVGKPVMTLQRLRLTEEDFRDVR